MKALISPLLEGLLKIPGVGRKITNAMINKDQTVEIDGKVYRIVQGLEKNESN